MPELALTGCTPAPLAGYLKGLGVFRLLSEQTIHNISARWNDECLILESPAFSEKSAHNISWVSGFFLDQYAPSPLVTPWNGRGGFLEGETDGDGESNRAGAKMVRMFTSPELSDRFHPISDALKNIAEFEAISSLNTSRSQFKRLKKSAEKKGKKNLSEEEQRELKEAESLVKKLKANLLVELRANLPDSLLPWFDACQVLSDKPLQGPMLGTGGLDGSMDFGVNYLLRLSDLINPKSGERLPTSDQWLSMALFGSASPGLTKKPLGQFSPQSIGGPNSTSNFSGISLSNPWDYVFMLEGAVLFAGNLTRQHPQDRFAATSFPFVLDSISAGSGSLGENDSSSNKTRGELWMPLWRQAASLPEIRALLSEGRVALGKRPAKDALDFIRAVHRLGGYRGVDRFQRYGLLMRSGKAYLATPLERVAVTRDPQTRWLDELENEKNNWLGQFRRFAQGDNVARRFPALRRRLEDRLFELAQREDPQRVRALLMLLGEIQDALATSDKAREIVKPLPLLSRAWVEAASRDSGPAFRIALALAGLTDDPGHNSGHKPLLPVRAQLYPVLPHPRFRDSNEWADQACTMKELSGQGACSTRLHGARKANLLDLLIDLLQRRLWLADRLGLDDKPLFSPAGVGLGDLDTFVNNPDLDREILPLMRGLALCRVTAPGRKADNDYLPPALGLLKLSLTPDAQFRDLGLLGKQDRIPIPKGMLAGLAAGQGNDEAILLAWRRLRSSGLDPLFTRDALPRLDGINPRRLAAALAIPIAPTATEKLVKTLLHNPVDNTAATTLAH